MFSQCQGDMNGDGIMNVVDLVASVNLILAGTFECEEENSVHGCIDSQACNYDAAALIDNNSCYYCYNEDCNLYPQELYDCSGNCFFEFDICGICGGNDFNEEGYHCGDVEVLMDIVNLNSIVLPDNFEVTDWGGQDWVFGRITQLGWTNRDLMYLPESIGNLTNLWNLNVSYNQLVSLPESIGDLADLEQLNVAFNNLSTLPESIGNITNINLNAWSNQISTFPQTIYNWTGSIDLGGNQLTFLPDLPDDIDDLSNLTIGLSSNQLTSLPHNICNIGNVGVQSNNLCEEYNYECVQDTFDEDCCDDDADCDECWHYSWTPQDQSNCCEGVNDEGETVPNWTTCP